VRPARPGTSDGAFPFASPVAFLTADNPEGEAVSEAVNTRRRELLADALDALGLAWRPAVGGDPDDVEHLEPGAVVLGVDLAAAATLGKRFRQAAVYVWTPLALHLVACDGDRHEVLGYTATPVEAAPVPRLRPA
jgi:hypothetical protein